MSFTNLKKNSKSNLEILQKKLEEQNKPSYEDDRFWKATKDKAGNGFAIIRFLPASEGEALPFAKYYYHSFKGPGGKFYNENCPTSLNGSKCYTCEQNSLLWNSGLDSDKLIARSRKRNLTYISNIYVVKDPANPENEGKVFLFRYGKKIHDKIMSSLKPELKEDEPIDPFDLWSGRNFRLKIKTITDGNNKFPNYDDSQLDPSSPLLKGDDKELEKVWKSQHKLTPFVDPSQFKSYEVLKEHFINVMGGQSSPSASTPTKAAVKKIIEQDEEAPFDENESAAEYFKRLQNDEENEN